MADDQSLVLSSNAKPRLKWTRQLHESFVEAVSRLGGADKATPRAVMRMMGVPGLTLYHLKSHLQKYRLAVRRDTEPTHNFNGDANCRTKERHCADTDMDRDETKIDEGMLQLHVELQRKLHEQIEVQRHLQLRIEAQGKYLQSVLRKAQETLSGYSLDSVEMEAAGVELSELVSAVGLECLSSSVVGSSPVQAPHADCSSDSCLTSLERPGMGAGSSYCNSRSVSNEIGANAGKPTKIANLISDNAEGGERGCSSICGDDCEEGQIGSGKGHSQVWEDWTGVPEEIDLNR